MPPAIGIQPSLARPPRLSKVQEIRADFLLRTLSPRLPRARPPGPPSGLAPLPFLRIGAAAYVSGERDGGVLPEETRVLARLAGAECLIVPGADHLEAIKRNPKEVIALALDTFARAESQAVLGLEVEAQGQAHVASAAGLIDRRARWPEEPAPAS